MSKLLVSLATYNEIAGLLEKSGEKINDGKGLILDKSTALVPPVDFRLIAIRRDCADIASKTFMQGSGNFVDYVNEIYEFVLNQKVPKIEIEKKSNPTPKTTW